MAQESVKIGPRWPSWSQHGPNMVQDAPTWAQRELHVAQESAKIGPRWPSWSQDGAPMAPRWPKMRQQGPRRAPRSSQDSQVGARMATTWPQDAKDEPAWPDICAYLEKLLFSTAFHNCRSPKGSSKMAQERARVGPRWPSWSQDGANMAPRWPKMRQPGPT